MVRSLDTLATKPFVIIQTVQSSTSNNPTNLGSVTLSEGKKIGGCYVLRKDLTRPGSSPVWLASDEVLGKEVTLHFVPQAVAADAQAMSELRQEVKRNRQLIHPNILRVYDLVEDGDCIAISMDRFEGESLAEALKKKGHFDAEELKPWAAQLAETLGDAHRIQLFHRDLAPSNLYVRPTGGLLVSNFGLSRVTANALERTGTLKGPDAHVAYLSPQQLDGEKVGASDDIYGFGALLHELLTGKPPFAGDDLVPQIRKASPPQIAAVRAGAGISTPVPLAWEKAIGACLAKGPEGRPKNLAEVVTMLGQDLGNSVADSDAASQSLPHAAEKAKDSHDSKPTSDTPVHISSEKAVEKSAVTTRSSDHSEMPPPVTPKSTTNKSAAKGALSANFPDLDRPKSKAPLVWLLLAASIMGVGIYVKNLPDGTEEDADGSVARIDNTPGTPVTPENPPAAIVNAAKQETTLPDPVPVAPTPKVIPAAAVAAQNPPAHVKPATNAGAVVLVSNEKHEKQPAVSETPDNLVPKTLASAAGVSEPKTDPKADPKAPKAVANAKPQPEVKQPLSVKQPEATPPVAAPAPKTVSVSIPLPDAPQPLPKLVLPAKATPQQLEDAKKEREAAITGIREKARAAEAALQDGAGRLAAVKADQEKLLKDIDARRKAMAPIIQQAESFNASLKKLEEGMTKTNAAAEAAKNAAAAAKQTYEDAAAKGSDKLKAKSQAETELLAATTEVTTRAKDIEGLTQLVAKADALKLQWKVSEQQAEQDVQKISSSIEAAHKAEMEQLRAANKPKIDAAEKQVQELQAQLGRLNAALGPLKELGETGKDAADKIQEKANAVTKQIGDLQAQIKTLTGGTAAASATPTKETAAVTPPQPTPEPVKETGAGNSLGMKFVPVGNVQFAVNLVTRKDFEAFATATGLKSDAWRNPGFKQDPDHPVVNVTWREAEAFCKWLTDKERKASLLKGNESYRLPSDLEWSKAVGLSTETGATPEERDMGVQDVYPWGTQWPPTAGAGNYAGEETQTEIPIPNYNDGYPNTSPVGKFKANALGLYDMGGNVWQWVSDFWNSENRAKTLRGGSWYNGAIPLSLLSSCRISSSPETLHDTYGFRIVKANETAKTKRR